LQRAYRRLLKIAELCDDAPLFAEVGRAFEITAPMYRRAGQYRGSVYVVGKGYVEIAPQRVAASPLLALSDQTSHYMRRRVWRILRKRGELGHASFAAMASALAARFEDGDMAGGDQTPAAPFRRVRRLWSLAHLSYGADSTLNFNSSRVTVTGAPRQVAPLFIDLWRRDVEGVLHLAQNARSAPGRALAAKLLAEIDAKRLSDHVLQLANIAAGPHEDLASLAARLLEPFVAAPDVSCGLLARVLDTRHEGLRRIALMAVDARGPWSEAALGLAALLARQPETIARVEAWIARAPTQPQLTALAEAFVERLAQAPADLTPEQAETFGLAARRLMQLAQGRALGLPAQRFAAFADHPAPGVRAAGLDLLAASGLPLDDLPHDFWTRGLNAPDAVLRAAAARLLGALSDEALARHADHVRAAVFDPDPAPRAAIRPAAAKLAARDPVFAEALYRAVTPHLFQSEPSEGFADDLAALIETALTQPRDAMRVDELWRMLRAQARGARLVSAGALAARADEIFDARRWARLTAHPMKTVRQRALAVFDAHEDWFRADPGAAAQLLDTRWEDVRAGALERLSRWPASAFSVEALAELADAADPGAQADARALLRRTIQPGAGGPTLARLMEHPSPAFQLFVTEILATEKLDTPALFERFLDAARIALFRVHAGRAVKARLWARLSNEACASRARAEAALPLIAQMSLSAVERDRAPALALLRDLRLAFPDLETPLALTRRAS
jgi:hypothetical protein